DRALGGANAAHPRTVALGQFAGLLLGLRDDDVRGDAHVRLRDAFPVLGGLEGAAVALHRLEHARRADVVVRRETQAIATGDVGALTAAAAEDPDLHVGSLAGHDVCFNP